jgi:hypothetical protein
VVQWFSSACEVWHCSLLFLSTEGQSPQAFSLTCHDPSAGSSQYLMLYQESQIVIHFFLSQTVASCLRGAVRKKGGSSQACLSELLLIPLSWTTKRNLQAAVSAAG